MVSRRAVIALGPLSVATAMLSAPVAQSQLPRQSPIDITRRSIRVDPSLPRLRISYGRSEVEIEYIRKDADSPTGCTTRHHEETEEGTVARGSGHVTLAGTRYDLVQFHFHTPSEHKFEGRHAPLEMHLVHSSAAGKLLVIGVPLVPGPASAVDKVLAKFAPECGKSVHVPAFDLNTLLPEDRTTARYDGSLTTAPFAEGVQWFITKEKTVTINTIRRFQKLFPHGNARETQPLNGRTVQIERW
ncbi:carbonic anhydrase family protein [Kibdelosporangium philippinense]|uniref:carbonic anhydrase n=1 Tax=Kibdelosporangium philippinense TaxID=211113 RepID=A0ABS8Z573_9PSEU|nr:carbonic anhydrase family protein [Kibdelosporangium philippinense]MCE7003064.1 carbonic anhydrase family protein [Kibdelosporangium philippinense]